MIDLRSSTPVIAAPVSVLAIILLSLALTEATAQTREIRYDKAERFAVTTNPPGAIIELTVFDYPSDTLGPAPMLIEHVRGGRGRPLGFAIRAIHRSSGECDQRRQIHPDMPVPDTVAFDMTACGRPTSGPGAVDDWYRVFAEAEVDQKPRLASVPQLDYPDLLRNKRIEGSVELEAVIDTSGRIDSTSIRVVKASHLDFARAAVDAALHSQYHPGLIANRPVRVRVSFPINFGIAVSSGGTYRAGPYVRPRTKRTLLP